MNQLVSPFMRYNLDCTLLGISLPLYHLQFFLKDVMLRRKMNGSGTCRRGLIRFFFLPLEWRLNHCRLLLLSWNMSRQLLLGVRQCNRGKVNHDSYTQYINFRKARDWLGGNLVFQLSKVGLTKHCFGLLHASFIHSWELINQPANSQLSVSQVCKTLRTSIFLRMTLNVFGYLIPFSSFSHNDRIACKNRFLKRNRRWLRHHKKSLLHSEIYYHGKGIEKKPPIKKNVANAFQRPQL